HRGGTHRGRQGRANGSSEKKRAPPGRAKSGGWHAAPAEGWRKPGRRAAAGHCTGGRYTSTGMSEWVSTLAVTLPSTSALMPRRPCEAIATRSQPRSRARSEEHTSELQSRENLVCRLLLEKQKMK